MNLNAPVTTVSDSISDRPPLLPSFHCRSCASTQGLLVLDLGNHPLANNLLTRPEQIASEPRFPLQLFVCKSCRLIQIGATVPPVNLFSEYVYFSSFSDTMLSHSKQAAERYIQELDLKNKDPLVVEVASNDGYMLKNFVREGIRCLGVEPASNIASVAIEAGIPTWVDFFGLDTARQILQQQGPANLILGSNVFAHAPDINDFVAGLSTLLHPQGRVVLEFPYAIDFLENNEFDTIYHEHVFYFSLTALQPVFQRHGLQMVDAERLSIHGGSIRLTICHNNFIAPTELLQSLLKQEIEIGILEDNYYQRFQNRVSNLIDTLSQLLLQLSHDGKKIAAYGASAKGSTLLNSLGEAAKKVEYIVDRSIYKHGKLSPGIHLPIYPAARLQSHPPDFLLLLTWNFAEEILQQQKSYSKNGGKFIIPVPEVKILDD